MRSFYIFLLRFSFFSSSVKCWSRVPINFILRYFTIFFTILSNPSLNLCFTNWVLIQKSMALASLVYRSAVPIWLFLCEYRDSVNDLTYVISLFSFCSNWASRRFSIFFSFCQIIPDIFSFDYDRCLSIFYSLRPSSYFAMSWKKFFDGSGYLCFSNSCWYFSSSIICFFDFFFIFWRMSSALITFYGEKKLPYWVLLLYLEAFGFEVCEKGIF